MTSCGGSTKAIARFAWATGSSSRQARTGRGSCTTWRPIAPRRMISRSEQPEKVRELARRWEERRDEFAALARAAREAVSSATGCLPPDRRR